jgi:magnesium-transporting ATPase (P-type)
VTTTYDNTVKFLRFQLSTNIAAILTVLGAPSLGFPTPFTAIQILWVNIIMDGPSAMTLGRKIRERTTDSCGPECRPLAGRVILPTAAL